MIIIIKKQTFKKQVVSNNSEIDLLQIKTIKYSEVGDQTKKVGIPDLGSLILTETHEKWRFLIKVILMEISISIIKTQMGVYRIYLKYRRFKRTKNIFHRLHARIYNIKFICI